MHFILWGLVGLVLSLPYIWLADLPLSLIPFTAFWAPPIGLLLMMVLRFERGFMNKRRSHFWLKYPLTIAAAMWLMLPVFMNAASLLLDRQGYQTAAQWTHTYRFTSLTFPLVLFAGILALSMIWSMLCSLFTRGNGTPPSSGGGGDHHQKLATDRSVKDPDRLRNSSDGNMRLVPVSD